MKTISLLFLTVLVTEIAVGQQGATTVIGRAQQLAELDRMSATQSWNSVTVLKPVNESEVNERPISIEVPASQDIVLENQGRNFVIHLWSGSTVKLATKGYFTTKPSMTDQEWMEKMGLSLRVFGHSVRISSKGAASSNYSYSTGGGQLAYSFGTTTINGNPQPATSSVVDADGKVVGTTKRERVVDVYIPMTGNIEIENRNGNIRFAGATAGEGAKGKMGSVKFTSSNGSFDAEGISMDRLSVRASYGTISFDKARDADLEMNNVRFSASEITNADVDSKYSTVEIVKAGVLKLRSENDQYELDEAAVIEGHKNYGSLRLSTVSKSIDLEGTNADFRVRNLPPSLESVKIDDKYAEVRLPVRDLRAFTLDMKGKFNTVYASFDKKAIEETEPDQAQVKETKPSQELRQVYIVGRVESNVPNHFTARVGEGKGTDFKITCNSCTVDFK